MASATAVYTDPDDPFVVEYAVPLADSGPRNLVLEAPGRIWFTAQHANVIGRLVVTSTVDYEFDFYPIPVANSEPYDLVLHGQKIWFTALAGNFIGQLDITSGVILTHPIPTPASAPTGIAISPNGRVWFVERHGNKVGYYDPATELLEEFAFTSPNGLLEDVATKNNDSIWFTAPGTNHLVRFVPSTGNFNRVLTSEPGLPLLTPSHVVLDANGIPWVSTSDRGFIGLYAPGTISTFRWYATSPVGAGLSAIFQIAEGGQIKTWFVESGSGVAGQLSTRLDAGYINSWRLLLPGTGNQPTGITVDANGHVWITGYGTNKIFEWRPPYLRETYLPLIMKQ